MNLLFFIPTSWNAPSLLYNRSARGVYSWTKGENVKLTPISISAEVRNEWSYTSIFPCVFMLRCLIKHWIDVLSHYRRRKRCMIGKYLIDTWRCYDSRFLDYVETELHFSSFQLWLTLERQAIQRKKFNVSNPIIYMTLHVLVHSRYLQRINIKSNLSLKLRRISV